MRFFFNIKRKYTDLFENIKKAVKILFQDSSLCKGRNTLQELF